MLTYARQACAMVHGRARPDLDSDLMLELALTRLIEIIGEAATRISRPTRDKHHQIPWSHIVGMRNRLIHGYDTVDRNLLWDTVAFDLPPLIAALEEILQTKPRTTNSVNG
ncbi:MAG: DUF86 domain-containing protein [Caldilinea sp.]